VLSFDGGIGATVLSFTQTGTASDWRLGVGDGGLSLITSSQIGWAVHIRRHLSVFRPGSPLCLR
jgi:hypothetical protein